MINQYKWHHPSTLVFGCFGLFNHITRVVLERYVFGSLLYINKTRPEVVAAAVWDTTGESSGRCVFQVPDEEEENEESLAHADHSKNKAEV